MLFLLFLCTLTQATPTVYSTNPDYGSLSYQGYTTEFKTEAFLNIPFGEDTGGQNRFKHPQAWKANLKSINATVIGDACPQPVQPIPGFPLFSNVTKMSEDCLNLRITRPAGTKAGDKLPVMAYIYGGGWTVGQIYDQIYTPDGLVLESAAIGNPVIYVAMNYRVSMFGFAASSALKSEASLNSGLLDQRLGLEWIQKNIADFGGDPAKVTLFGESAGAQSVAFQLTAYGGLYDAPFSKAILESGSSLNDASNQPITVFDKSFNAVAKAASILSCVRKLPVDVLNAAVIDYERTNFPPYGFQVFFPVVDSDFLPLAQDELISHGAFYRNIATIHGWNEDDGALFTPTTINSTAGVKAFVKKDVPGLSEEQVETLLKLYPVKDFIPAKAYGAEFDRASRFDRDLIYTCGSVWFARQLTLFGGTAYLYLLNQTALGADIPERYYGVTHFSDLLYVFNSVSAISNSTSDQTLANEISGAWSTFATAGEAWTPAFGNATTADWGLGSGVMNVFGGGNPGIYGIGELVDRCTYIATLWPSFKS